MLSSSLETNIPICFINFIHSLNSVLLSPRLIIWPRQKNQVCPTIFANRERKKEGFIPFRRTLMPSETQTDTSRIWTRVADFTFSDEGRDTTHTYVRARWPSGLSVRQCSGRPGFNPRLSHTKDFKNGTWYLLA